MRRDAISAVLSILVFTVLLGLVYPLAVTGIGQVVFPNTADGSQVEAGGKVVGSSLIAQPFTKTVTDENGNSASVPDERYFQPRPSQTDYNPAGTSFNNAGPNNSDTRDLILANAEAYVELESEYNPDLTVGKVPVDAAMNSASGVDPHISEANAEIQSYRVAAVRKIPLTTVTRLIEEHTDGRFLGVIGEPGVNVLELNIALDAATKEGSS